MTSGIQITENNEIALERLAWVIAEEWLDTDNLLYALLEAECPEEEGQNAVPSRPLAAAAASA